jgi:hypothetical protein
VKLILSPTGPGERRIIADGLRVGHAITEWDERDPWNGGWRAFLWATAGTRDGRDDRTVYRFRLRELRAELERRLAEEGPWWQ